jgi:hypothetical protein
MENKTPVEIIVAEIHGSITAASKRERRLLSKTFWDKFGVQKRTPKVVKEIEDALTQYGIKFNLNGTSSFGKEEKGAWITLSCEKPEPSVVPPVPDPSALILPTPTPDASWFKQMIVRDFESEREIETFFIVPLLQMLGYCEDDLHIGCPVTMYQGVTAIKKQADVAAFNGKNRKLEHSLILVEAKLFGKLIKEEMIGQARSYALNLTTPFYVVTNGVEIHVYQNLNGSYPDSLLMLFPRMQLQENWTALYQRLNKAAVIDHKKRLAKSLLSD